MAVKVYDIEIVQKILDRLANGETLTKICKSHGMPHTSTVAYWITTDADGFADKYAAARMLGYSVMADEIIDISDDASKEEVARSRLRVDTRKWILAKCLPKIYGAKATVSFERDTPKITREELESQIKQLCEKLGVLKDE